MAKLIITKEVFLIEIIIIIIKSSLFIDFYHDLPCGNHKNDKNKGEQADCCAVSNLIIF